MQRQRSIRRRASNKLNSRSGVAAAPTSKPGGRPCSPRARPFTGSTLLKSFALEPHGSSQRLTSDLAVHSYVHEHMLPLRAAAGAMGERWHRRLGRTAAACPQSHAPGLAALMQGVIAQRCLLRTLQMGCRLRHHRLQTPTYAPAAAARFPAAPPAPAPPLGAPRWPGTSPCPAALVHNTLLAVSRLSGATGAGQLPHRAAGRARAEALASRRQRKWTHCYRRTFFWSLLV